MKTTYTLHLTDLSQTEMEKIIYQIKDKQFDIKQTSSPTTKSVIISTKSDSHDTKKSG